MSGNCQFGFVVRVRNFLFKCLNVFYNPLEIVQTEKDIIPASVNIESVCENKNPRGTFAYSDEESTVTVDEGCVRYQNEVELCT